MRESSGKHCEGRDMSENNQTGETAEAGLFQVSFAQLIVSILVAVVRAGADRFYRRVRRRNAVEYAACVFVVICIRPVVTELPLTSIVVAV